MQTDNLCQFRLSRKHLLCLPLVLFAVSILSAAQQGVSIYTFKAGFDGSTPEDGLVADQAGNLYGTTVEGGGSVNCGKIQGKILGCGIVFQLAPPVPGSNRWTETILYTFEGLTASENPTTPVAFDAAGNLYGTAARGGTNNEGTIFELSPPAQPGGAWTETVLYSFTTTDGNAPSGVVLDTQGNLYGEVANGNSFGEVYELSPPTTQGGAWTFTVLHSFTGTDGTYPSGGLVMDARGTLYGAAYEGGTGRGPVCPGGSNCGSVFALSKQNGNWITRVLYEFPGRLGTPASPFGGVTLHGGSLYGTSAYGGNAPGDGTVYELSPPENGGQTWTETTLYQFSHNSGGFRPESGVVFDNAGNLYSTVEFAPLGQGEAFKLSPSTPGNPWTLTPLHDFNCSVDGCSPLSSLIFGKGGSLYGMAEVGGLGGAGTVFRIVP